MCGICGLIGRGTIDKDVEAFTELLYFSAVRGPHSTGLMTYTPTGIYKKPSTRISKVVGPSSYFIGVDNQRKIEDKMIRTMMTETFLAHCRYATVGNITRENAHPFDTGNLISAHNGTLWDKIYGDKEKTDSQMMFEDIEKRGVKTVLSSLHPRSAYAVSIFDKRDKSVTLARNNERPLYVGLSQKRDVLYWASEKGMLDLINARYKLDLAIFHLQPFTTYKISAYKVKIKNMTPWVTEEWDEPKYQSTIITGFQSPTATTPWVEDFYTQKEHAKVTKSQSSWDSEWCSTCGEELFGKGLFEATAVYHGKDPYYTCKTCTDAIKGSSDKQRELKLEQEVKVG